MSNEHYTPDDRLLLPEHRRILEERAIPIDFAIRHGVRSIDLTETKRQRDEYGIEGPRSGRTRTWMRGPDAEPTEGGGTHRREHLTVIDGGREAVEDVGFDDDLSSVLDGLA